MTFKSIEEKIISKYKLPREYLTNYYPANYFDYYIDVGARGIKNPWHLHKMGMNNPKTLCFGYEPDLPWFEELKREVENLDNVKLYPHGFSSKSSIVIPDGTANTVDLKDIISQHNINLDSRWMIKFDCEGCEYFLLEQRYNVDILKKASHIALEFHSVNVSQNFFTDKYNYPDSFKLGESWMNDNFSDTHSIFVTSQERGMRTYILLAQNIMDEKDNLFLKDLL